MEPKKVNNLTPSTSDEGEEKEIKHQIKKRTKFTIVSIINLMWYTIVVLILTYFDKTVPSELTISWFAAWTAELAILFGIKVTSKDNPNPTWSKEYDYIEKQDKKIEEKNFKAEVQDENSVQDYDNCVG